jgi:uncharacterized protein (UPF0333 family)
MPLRIAGWLLVRPKGAAIMSKLISIVVAIIIFALLVLAYVEMGKKTADEGKAFLETSREAVNRAKQSADEMSKRTDRTNKEVEKLLGGEKK